MVYNTFTMPAPYDSMIILLLKGREYEYSSEFLAIKEMLLKIPKVDRSIEIGAGFGRLLPFYQFRVKKAVLSDPSAKLISIARKKYRNNKRIEFIQSTLDNLKNTKRAKSFDLCIMIRVLHHIEDIDSAFVNVSNLLKEKGLY
jgi:ubiquinone/menaquinone biosynthesis C-methylase UbiE